MTCSKYSLISKLVFVCHVGILISCSGYKPSADYTGDSNAGTGVIDPVTTATGSDGSTLLGYFDSTYSLKVAATDASYVTGWTCVKDSDGKPPLVEVQLDGVKEPGVACARIDSTKITETARCNSKNSLLQFMCAIKNAAGANTGKNIDVFMIDPSQGKLRFKLSTPQPWKVGDGPTYDSGAGSCNMMFFPMIIPNEGTWVYSLSGHAPTWAECMASYVTATCRSAAFMPRLAKIQYANCVIVEKPVISKFESSALTVVVNTGVNLSFVATANGTVTYNLDYSTDGGATYVSLLSGTSNTSATISPQQVGTHLLRLTAINTKDGFTETATNSLTLTVTK